MATGHPDQSIVSSSSHCTCQHTAHYCLLAVSKPTAPPTGQECGARALQHETRPTLEQLQNKDPSLIMNTAESDTINPEITAVYIEHAACLEQLTE